MKFCIFFVFGDRKKLFGIKSYAVTKISCIYTCPDRLAVKTTKMSERAITIMRMLVMRRFILWILQ